MLCFTWHAAELNSSRLTVLLRQAALVQLQDGDVIRIDAETRKLDLVGVSEEELGKRLAAFKPPPYKATAGTLYKYIKSVSSASLGCVTDL